jgi:hypothetical protein
MGSRWSSMSSAREKAFRNASASVPRSSQMSTPASTNMPPICSCLVMSAMTPLQALSPS